MPRRVQDIIPGNHRSIRDIPARKNPSEKVVSNGRIEKNDKQESTRGRDIEIIKIHHERETVQPSYKKANDKGFADESKNVQSIEKTHKKKKNNKASWILAILGIIIIVAGVAFGLSGHFASATFTLVPQKVAVNVGGTYVIPAASSTVFGYELTNMTEQASTTVPATIGSYVETKAVGSITVYNSYSSIAQKLVAGSRLVGHSGLIYRLTSSIVVPGYRLINKVIVPGSISSTFIAEKAGGQYNISSTDAISDFTFPAYKGTEKYIGFYARLNGDVTGGFIGTKTVVSPTLIASTTAILQAKISSDLKTKMMNIVPNGYVMYPDAFTGIFSKTSVASLDPKSATITLNGTIYGILFKQNSFARFIAGTSSTSIFNGMSYDTPGLDSLNVIFANKKDFSPITKTNLALRISGSFNMSGFMPIDQLKQDFSSVPLSKTANILKKYASIIDIAHSSIEINPPWINSIPSDKSRINIIVKNI